MAQSPITPSDGPSKRQPPPPLTELYLPDYQAVRAKYGAVFCKTNCTQLLTPHEHEGQLYRRRIIRNRQTIYTDAAPLPSPQKNPSIPSHCAKKLASS